MTNFLKKKKILRDRHPSANAISRDGLTGRNTNLGYEPEDICVLDNLNCGSAKSTLLDK